jgi:hypothetical protein
VHSNVKLVLVAAAFAGLGFAVAQTTFKFDNSKRLNTVFDIAKTQIAISDAAGYYPLAVQMDKISNAGETRWTQRFLKRGLEYRFIAIGEGGKGINDVDIKITSAKDKTPLIEDSSDSNIAQTKWFVTADGYYNIGVSGYDMGSATDGFFSLVIAARKP